MGAVVRLAFFSRACTTFPAVETTARRKWIWWVNRDFGFTCCPNDRRTRLGLGSHVDAARTRVSRRHGRIPPKVDLDDSAALSPALDRSILALDEALKAFSQVTPRQAKVVELRHFGGLTEEEIVAALKISPRTRDTIGISQRLGCCAS